MGSIAPLGVNHIEEVARLLEGEFTHKELDRYFEGNGLEQFTAPGSSAKWSRIFGTFANQQGTHGCSNHLFKFIMHVMEPVRFRSRPQEYQTLRMSLNEVLAFHGMQLGEDNQLRKVSAARTLTEAQERAGRLRAELLRRSVHADVLQFCRAELLQENYFHAVLEAMKSIAQKIRDRTGLTGDGCEIVDTAFAIKSPLLAINTLRTDTEKDEQKGFATLLRGAFGTFRNPHAHAPKVLWATNEQDALDLLTLLSYFHRRIDAAASIPQPAGTTNRTS